MLLIDRRIARPEQENWSHWLRNTAASCVRMRRKIGLPLAGVCAWMPEVGFYDRFKIGVRARDRDLVQQILSDGLTSLVDLQDIVDPSDNQETEPPNFLETRRQLLKHLASGPKQWQAQGSDLGQSFAEYDDAVRRELAEPLIGWAQQHHSAVIRAAGVQLAEVLTLLHRITPRLQSLYAVDQMDAPRATEDLLLSKSLQAYLGLLDRFARLCREIMR